jgi:arylsulfatase A-like enzyme
VSGFADVLPTLAELSGASAPRGLDGMSFLPTLLTGSQPTVHEFMYWEHYVGTPAAMIQAVRAGDWKIVQRKPGEPFELHDLAKDLSEKTNLAAAHPDVVKHLADIAAEQHTTPRKDPGDSKRVGINDYVR